MIILAVSLLGVIFAPQTSAWPSDDQGGPYFTMQIDAADAPVIDGIIDGTEWNTEEEPFRDTFDQALSFPQGTVNGLVMSIVILTDGTNLYVKVGYETSVVASATQPNSVGLAFMASEPAQMAQTYDRKVAFWDGTTMNNTDLFNCQNFGGSAELSTTDFCLSDPNYLQPGVPDIDNNFQAQFGFSGSRGFFEFSIPMASSNATEDFPIGSGTYIQIVVNPYDNIAASGVGHGGLSTNTLFIQYEPRCFFCQPPEGMDGNAAVFNIFFAILISMIYLTLLYAGRSESFASKLWKVEVSEEQARESVIMEMAYYNSSFLSILISAFFLMYSLIGLFYGIWAQWGLLGAFVNGIPTLLGILTIVDLIKRNVNPQEMEGEKLGTDYNEAGKFWLVPTLFLAITLLMLVFIGIDVIA